MAVYEVVGLPPAAKSGLQTHTHMRVLTQQIAWLLSLHNQQFQFISWQIVVYKHVHTCVYTQNELPGFTMDLITS